MKRIKNPGSVLQVARLYRPRKEAVKAEVLKLLKATPPFSYDDLYRLVWDHVRGLASKEQVALAIQRIGQPLKRESYQRALAPTCRYFDELKRDYATLIEPRTYALGRNMRVQCAPPMICGTENGLVVPWPMFWKVNPLNEEQTAFFMSMAMDVMGRDGELDEAELIVVDTSTKALDKEGRPRRILGSEVAKIPAERLNAMVEVFLQGYALAIAEWNTTRSVKEAPVHDQDSDQMSFAMGVEG